MPRFLVVHTAPFTEEELVARAKSAPGYMPKGVSWKCSYCYFDGDKHFCEWEAPNKEAIERLFKKLDVPFDAIYPVKIFNAATASLEK